MIIVHSESALSKYLQSLHLNPNKVGFVPTMGALHLGHLSLVESAKKFSDHVVVSIFVNPTQFNQQKDLESYPRTIDHDINMLISAGVDLLFLPSLNDIYPNGTTYSLDFNPIDLFENIEGNYRPGHFKGVAQVVKRLLDLVRPDSLYMGAKDYQQVCVVRSLIAHYRLAVKLMEADTIREQDGLAMSSRNTRLTPEERQAASLIPEALQTVRKILMQGGNIKQAVQEGTRLLHTESLIKLEYLEVLKKGTVETYTDEESVIEGQAVICIACWSGIVRLIDNIHL